MDEQSYDSLRDDYLTEIVMAKKEALDTLKDWGIVVGADVRRTYDGRRYLITRICFKVLPGYLYGRQYRKDGTLGEHIHSIGTPASIEVCK